jgi:biopolymer transport protein ExbD
VFSWDENPDLNITPFVDVMLVLMAILMITAPTITYQEKITLPQGTKSTPVKHTKSLTIRMDKELNIYLGKGRYNIKDFADTFTLKSAKIPKDIDIYIRADERVRYKYVIYLLKSIKEAGFSKVSLLTE